MYIKKAILSVPIIVEIYLTLTANFALVNLFFDAGETVLPNFPYTIYVFSMYANFVWRLRRFTSKSIWNSVISSISIWMAGRLLLKSTWIMLISCAAKFIRCAGSPSYTIASGSKQQIWLSYASLILAVLITNFVFLKNAETGSQDARENVGMHRRSKILKYRISK